MKKLFLVFLIIPLINIMQAQNDSALFDNIGTSYHFDQNQIISSDSLFVANKSRDLTPLTEWLPEDLAGATPEDICYVSDVDKLYIYGKRNILVYDPSTNSIVNQLNVSNLTQYYPAIEHTRYLNYNHFAYNPNDKLLYCVLEDASIIVIDVTSTDDDITAVIPSPLLGENSKYDNFFLRYNDLNDFLYFVISTESTRELNVYNVSDNTHAFHLDFNSPEKKIRGIEVSESRNEFYLSVDDQFIRYQFDPTLPFDSSNPTSIILHTYSNDNSAGNILLINDTQNSIDKLFCFPNRYNNTGSEAYYILDFSTGVSTTKTCPTQITSAIYDGNGVVLFSCRTDATQNDLIFINATNYNTITAVNTQSTSIEKNNATLDMEMLNGKVLIAKESEIVTVDPSSNYNVNQELQGESNYFSRITPHSNGCYVSGIWSTDVIDISSSGSYSNQIEVGATVFYACHSPVNSKIYFYNKHRQGRAKVYIYNTSTEETNIIEFENPINDIEINPFDNNAMVSTEESSATIKVIDGTTDALLASQSWIQLNHGFIGEMFISANNKLHCIIGEDPTDGPGIEIRQLGAGSNTFVAFEQISSNVSHQITGVFTTNAVTNPTTDYVYVAVRLRSGQNLGWLAIINDNNHDIEIESITEGAFDIEFNGSVYLYIAHESNSLITQYNISDETTTTFNLSGNVYDLEANLKKQYVYALHRGTSQNTISTIFRTTAIPFVSELPIYSSSLKFNSMSDFLYVYVPYTANTCTFSGTTIYEIFDNNDDIEHINAYTYFDHHRKRYEETHTIPVGHSLIIDNDNGYIYFGGAGHNLLHKLELQTYETLQLRENISWMSVPRHERTHSQFETETEKVFGDEYISGYVITDLELAYNYIDPVTLQEGEKYSNYDGSNWSHEQHMYYVNSTRGYKLEITPNQSRNLYMFGDQEPPITTIDLYGDKSNWIGYFIEEEQDIFDAIGTYADDIYEIKHQDWTCIFTENPWFGPTGPGTEPQWFCDQQSTNIKYGEMIVVKPFDNVNSFQWVDPDQGSIAGTLAIPENFTYEEEPDYQTYIIALDSTENPQEIGAFSADTCIGACVVESQDSIAMIKAYNTGSNEDSISFEPFYGTKSSANKRIREYYVYNEKENRNEKRVIRSGELKGVYFISFQELKVKQASDNIELYSLNAYPNPAHGELTVEFEVPNESNITICLFDMYGRTIKTVYAGTPSSGKHISKMKLFDQSGMSLPEGLYILNMISPSGNVTSQKIMIR